MKNFKKYIGENVEINKYITLSIKDIENSEIKLNKPIEDFNTNELLNLLKSQSYSSMARTRALLSKYFDWCVIKGIIKENLFLVDNTLLLKNINQLKMNESEVFTADDFKILMLNLSIYRHAQFIIYSLYAGISLNDLAKIKISNLDFSNKKIKLKDKEFKIDDEFKRLFEIFYNTDKRIQANGTRNDYLVKYKDYILSYKNDPRLKEFESDEEFEVFIARHWMKYARSVLNELNIDLSLRNIKKYGSRDRFIFYLKEKNITPNKENLGHYLYVYCHEIGINTGNIYNEFYGYYLKVFNIEDEE